MQISYMNSDVLLTAKQTNGGHYGALVTLPIQGLWKWSSGSYSFKKLEPVTLCWPNL